ncbi:MAG: MerR family DNA-binding transcriptional regulator [Thauera sp.]|jgi:DNA-binding transcriptional MerR regulator|nr:MerR family DNA-binding transcriptional regulator [Thauera sp.]
MDQEIAGRTGRVRESANATTYTISDLAKEFDITTRAIRYYEDQGLISPARRGSRRIYSRRDRVRLSLILRGKRLGFSLQETRELFDLYDNAPGEQAQMSHFMELLGARRAMLERQMEDIRAILDEIDAAEKEARRSIAARVPGPKTTMSPSA